MASFIPALSFFILVLFNGYFTLPINDEQLSSTTFLLLNDDVTTENAFNLRLISNDETTELPGLDKKSFIDEHIGFEMSTATLETFGHAVQKFNELSAPEFMTLTTESSLTDKRDDRDDFLFTTMESSTKGMEFERRSFKTDFENETESESDPNKREMPVEFTTSNMLLFTSTASNVAPKLYTSESSTSTEKYTGLLKYQKENKEEEEEPEEPTKLTKTIKKVSPIKPIKVEIEDQSTEDLKGPTAPTAVFDQEALKKISYVPNDFLILDENNTLVVTELPEKLSTSTLKNLKEQKPLTQGEESLQPEEKEPNH